MVVGISTDYHFFIWLGPNSKLYTKGEFDKGSE